MKTTRSFLAFALGLIASIDARPLVSSATSSVAVSTPTANVSAVVNTVAASAPTLLPAVHWQYPVANLENLKPNKNSDLYYSHNGTSGDPTVKHLFASLSATFQHESVVLDHSSFVNSTTCQNNEIHVKFTSTEAHEYAFNAWSATQSFMLVTYTDSCGSSLDQRTFFLVEELQQDSGDLLIIAKVQEEMAVDSILDEVQIAWGTYHPSHPSNVTTYSPANQKRGIEKSADISVAPANQDQSPWGPASLIFSGSGSVGDNSADVSLYCVGCGVTGHVTVAGTSHFGVFKGLEELNIATNANLQANFSLGLVANVALSKTFTKQLITQAIPDLGITVTGIFTAGVFVELDASTTLEIETNGQAVMGLGLSIPDFNANIDVLNNEKSSVTGYHPQFSETFSANGTISSKVTFSLPISLNFGFDIKPLSIKKAISLIEQPAIVGDVSYTNDANATCANAFDVKLNAQNDISLAVLGHVFPLNHVDSPSLYSGCVPVGASA